MPLGLSNTPASFHCYINKILAKKFDIFVIVYLDDILIYIKDPGQDHVEAMGWVLNILQRQGLFANLKRCRFHKDKICFLGYVVSAQRVKIEDEQIKAVKNWPKPMSVRDIQVFIGVADFYRRFIQGFSRIAALVTSMLKTIGSSDLALKVFKADGNKVVGVNGRVNETVKDSSKSKKSKNKKSKISTRFSDIGAT